jgi:hypothetical protein
MAETQLCEYCSAIDFERLRLPLTADLQMLNDGGTAPDRRPFKSNKIRFDDPDPQRELGPFKPFCAKLDQGIYTPHWSLGLQSRVDGAECSLCDALRQLIRRKPQIRTAWVRKGLQDAVCIAWISRAGRVTPPTGLRWEGRRSFDIHHLSFGWASIQSDRWTKPGLVKVSVTEDFLFKWDSYLQAGPMGPAGFPARGGAKGETVFGGRLRPRMLDPELPRKWLFDCCEDHGEKCGQSPQSHQRYAGVLSL